MTASIDIQEIKKILPTRYLQTLRKRLIDRHGKHFSTSYISQVMTSDEPSINSVIVKEAILWAEEIRDENEEFARKLENLKTIEG